MVGIAHPQLTLSRQLSQSHERLRALKCSFFTGKKEHRACLASSKALELSDSAAPSESCFQEFFVVARNKCPRLWFPGKGTRNMAPQVPGLFYSTKLQASIAWWKMPHHFASKKVLRWVEHGVKVEFSKGIPFAPKPSVPKFVDPSNVDFAIKDLLKGRRIGGYQDLALGGEQFLFVTLVIVRYSRN